MKHFDAFPEPLLEGHPQLGLDPCIHPTCRIRDCQIGVWTELMERTEMLETRFGDYSYTAGDVMIHYADVGKFCSIASHVRINPGNHPMQRVTQHHCTYRKAQYGFGDGFDAEVFEMRRSSHCKIGHDVWIGHAATIMPGVSVGSGAIIGSGAVVTKDVKPYEIVAGVPSARIRMRFPPEIVAALLKIEWWDWEHSRLKERFDELLDVEAFVAKYG